MSKQREAYLNGLGDNWYYRNKESLGGKTDDPVEKLLSMVEHGNLKTILEVGCANGWRMAKLKREGLEVFGIDPSKAGISEARKTIEYNTEKADFNFQVGTADYLPWPDGMFDCVIMGFCMWAMAPEDWFPAVSESDRVLKNGGLLIIHDRFSARPIKRLYPESEDEEMFQYSYDWKKLWLSHPGYTEVAEAMGVWPGTTSIEGAVMLHKDLYTRLLRGQNNPEVSK